MAFIDDVVYQNLFLTAFVSGAGAFAAYWLLNMLGRRFTQLGDRSRKLGSAGLASIGLALALALNVDALLTCDQASAGLAQLRLQFKEADNATLSGLEQQRAQAKARIRFCSYYRDQCVDMDTAEHSDNWQYCLRSKTVSPET